MLEDNEKQMDIYTKDMLIRNVARKCNLTINQVKEAVHLLEDEVFEALSTADKDKEVLVRLFDGISIGAKLVPGKTKVNNLTGEEIDVPERIKPKAAITRYYVDNLNK